MGLILLVLYEKDCKGLPVSVVKAKMKTGQQKVTYEHKGGRAKEISFLWGHV